MSTIKKEEAKAERLVETLYQYFMDYPMRMSQEFIHLIEEKALFMMGKT